ncbi:carboxylesterase family protein [Novosphingobium colocasiae]
MRVRARSVYRSATSGCGNEERVDQTTALWLAGCLLAVLPHPVGARPLATIVQTQSGAVRGAAEAGVMTWKGIPFAASPTGAWRWRAPRPPQAMERSPAGDRIPKRLHAAGGSR